MLLRLQIQNLAIIDALTLDFQGGFTALTGETGAGKSIIVGALKLLLGERASSEDIRTGCASAVVEALFDITGRERVIRLLQAFNLLEVEDGDAGELVLRREISTHGRGRCLLNGKLITLAQLKRLGDLLVDLHGQHLHQSLLNVELHREIIDAFGGPPLGKCLETYRALFARHGEVLSRLRSLDRGERGIERQKGLLEFQLCEIDEAALERGEDDRLEEEAHRLRHALELKQNTAGANDLLFEGEVDTVTVFALLARCEKMLQESASLDPSLDELAARLTGTRTDLEDIAATLRSYAAGLSLDPDRLEEVEDRLHLIRKLKKKYGATLEEILTERDRMEAEFHALTHSTEDQEGLKAERATLEGTLASAAQALTEQRQAAGERFSKGLCRQLAELEMPHVRFQVSIRREKWTAQPPEDPAPQEEEDGRTAPGRGRDRAHPRAIRFQDGKQYRIQETGVDQVEFLISPNPGEDLKSLRRIASGGELSRIMLALKMLMRSLDQVPTLIFDEIDTGISGRTGAGIGEKMAKLGGQYQVICITHLPQIAARADAQFSVRKVREKKRTLTRVERLDRDGRLEEIARLLGGRPDSPSARSHAKELLSQQTGTNRRAVDL